MGLIEIKSRYYDFLETLSEKLSWSVIALFGNTYLAKAALLTPVLGQVVHSSGEIINKYLGFIQVGALYWSLVYLAIGQAIYTVCCPREIKKYGGNLEQFKIDKISTTTVADLDRLFLKQLRSHFVPGGGSWVCPKYEKEEFVTILDLIFASGKIKREEIFSTAPNDHIFNSYTSFHSRVAYDRALIVEIDWGVIRMLNYFVPLAHRENGTELSSDEKSVLIDLFHEREDDSWKYGAVERQYRLLDKKSEVARIYIVLFYATGSIYFILNFVVNMWRMLVFSLNSII